MQKTELSVLGVPGRVHAFSAKTSETLTGRWEYTVERSLWELTVSKVDDYTADDMSDYTMEVP